MFGYITPLVCELKVCEHELFQAYYCGLCKALKKQYSKTSVLNYDCTFLYLLGDSLRHDRSDVRQCQCFLHPIKKKQALYSNSADYAAAVNILMAAAKAKDDILDNAKPSARFRQLFLKSPYKKAVGKVPEIAEMMHGMARDLHEMEQRGSANTDEVADTYAKLFGNVLMELDVLQSHILYELGYALGRWVYLIDAYDDIAIDLKNGDYNVFVNKYGITGDVPDAVRQEILFGFNYTLSQAMDALGRLELKKNRSILENIIGLGLKQRTLQAMGLLDTTDGKERNESVSGAGRS